tara:strand:+ start:66 stop:392 length:327 start_codon:yes stop_codon:yes gene_type:complete
MPHKLFNELSEIERKVITTRRKSIKGIAKKLKSPISKVRGAFDDLSEEEKKYIINFNCDKYQIECPWDLMPQGKINTLKELLAHIERGIRADYSDLASYFPVQKLAYN